MPAVVDDPSSPTIYRVSGQASFPDPGAPLPETLVPRKVTLRDRQTVATILPIVSAQHQVPESLVTYLCGQINREIEGGDTYPIMETFTPAGFAAYWFQNFGAVMLLGDFESADDIPDSHDWARDCLGSFYIKPNYPGRSSHICNGGLLVTDASRNRGVGRLMGESYIDWAPRLGYTYSVFNLVYETNVASCKIWDALGFKRIGRVKGCGNLKSHPDRLVDAIIYGRDLPPPRIPGEGGVPGEGGLGAGDDLLVVSEERFDKIRYYLKFGRYPNGADRAEKSRLRSAATHYKLLDDGDTLMLKDKLVVSDPARQYEIARETHSAHHGGINKTTAIIAEKYHWSRIKETVSDVIRLCKDCKELVAKAPPGTSTNGNGAAAAAAAAAVTATTITTNTIGPTATRTAASKPTTPVAGVKRSRSPTPENDNAGPPTLPRPLSSPPRSTRPEPPYQTRPSKDTTIVDNDRVLGLRTPHTNSTLLAGALSSSPSTTGGGGGHPLLHDDDHGRGPGPYANPSDISVLRPSQTTGGFLHNHVANGVGVYQPIDPQIMNHDADVDVDSLHAFDGYHPHADFQALLHATEDDEGGAAERERRAAMDRDLEMLIEHDEDDMAVLTKPDKQNGGGGNEGGGAGGGGGGQADADMDDLDDSVLRDTGGWT